MSPAALGPASRGIDRVTGAGNGVARWKALIDFNENLQGDINRQSGSAPTYGFQVPPLKGRNIRTSFRLKGNRVYFKQAERIGSAVYASSYLMSIGQSKTPSVNPTSLSSATAHYLEAVRVLTGEVDPTNQFAAS